MSVVPPPGWLQTVAPGSTPVAVVAFAPNAVTAGDVAIVGVLLAGFGLLIVVNVLALIKRSV